MGPLGSIELQKIGSTAMELICLRKIPAIDAESLASCEASEALLRDGDDFFLYLSKDVSVAPMEEKLIRVTTREALIWLNEAPQDQGSFWG